MEGLGTNKKRGKVVIDMFSSNAVDVHDSCLEGNFRQDENIFTKAGHSNGNGSQGFQRASTEPITKIIGLCLSHLASKVYPLVNIHKNYGIWMKLAH